MNAQELPLAGFERFRTSDLQEARSRVERLLSSHRLEPARARARLDVRYHSVDLVETSIIYAQYGTAVRLDPGCLERFYLVGMPLAGSSTVSYGGRSLLTHSGIASVQSCTRAVATEWQPDCRKLSIKIGRQALERRLAGLLGHAPAQPLEFELGLDLESGPGASWSRFVRFLLAELSPESVYLRSAASRLSLEDAIISSLLFAQPHTYSERLLAEAPRIAPRHVRRAEELVAADPALPHCPADLAAQVGVSVRSLQEGFRRFRGMTPMQFVLQQRLEQVRAGLLQAGGRARVTELALSAGFNHLGRFAQAYRDRFGESPSQTLERTGRG